MCVEGSEARDNRPDAPTSSRSEGDVGGRSTDFPVNPFSSGAFDELRKAASAAEYERLNKPYAPLPQRDCTDHVATLGVRTPSIRTVPRIRVGRCPAHGSARVRRVRVFLADSRERPRRAARRGDAFSTD